MKVIVLAIVNEEKKEEESFTDFVKRLREKYCELNKTDDITLKVMKA